MFLRTFLFIDRITTVIVIRVLPIFIPLTELASWLAGENATLLFILSAIAIIPASLYIEMSTDRLSAYVGPTIGGLPNCSICCSRSS
ncbi:MAG: hypothetical protein NTW21_16185 [Verrucomicrobia bacterium]|nr:hypothetical protein [Verrucomicrobiota bacterium]